MTCDIFKTCGISKWIKCSCKGEVASSMNPRLQTVVYRITGAPATNYIHFPQTSSHSLNNTNKYCYIVWKPTPGKYFVLHFDCITRDGLSVRISFSNLFKRFHCIQSNIQFPYMFDPITNNGRIVDTQTTVQILPSSLTKWTVLIINFPKLFAEYYQSVQDYGYLKCIQLCADVSIQSVFTSDVLYTPDCLPDLVPLTGFNDVYDYLMVPIATETTPTPSKPSVPVPIKDYSVSQGISAQYNNGDDTITRSNDSIIQRHPLSITTASISANNKYDEKSLLELVHVIGIGPCDKIVFTKLGTRVFYCCNSIIVAMETSSYCQQFFIGHSAEVVCIDVNENCLLLASGDINGIIRLWTINNNECVSIVKTPTSTVCCLRFSFDGDLLCSIESQPTTISLFNVSTMEKTITHTINTVNITCVVFLSVNSMVTCGRGNIRIWRIKDKQLKSSPVNIEDYHSVVFTDVAHHNGNIYVSSKTGLVLEIDVTHFSLQRIWDLHPSDSNNAISINSIVFNDVNNCITGTSDGVVRVWSADFNAVVMEIDLLESIMCVGVANDNAICATRNSIGILNTTDECYNTILRTHCNTITGAGRHRDDNKIITCTSDGYIEVWNLENKQMIYQFHSAEDTPTAVCFVPHQSVIGCCYDNGIIRMISLDDDQLLVQHSFNSKIVDIISSNNGHRLYCNLSNGTILVFDSADYSLYNQSDNSILEGDHGRITVSNDDTVLTCTNNNKLIHYNARTLQQINIVSTISPIIDLVYSASNSLLILTDDSQVWRYPGTNNTPELLYSSVVHLSCIAVINDNILITGRNGSVNVISDDGTTQVFIGHDSPVNKLIVTSDFIISCAKELLVWQCYKSPVHKGATPLPNQRLMVPMAISDIPKPQNDIFESPSAPNRSHDTSCDNLSCDQTDNHPIIPKPKELFVAPLGNEVIQLHQIIGYTGSGRGTVQWYPPKGIICYSSECVVILENAANNGRQQFLIGHHTDITTLGLQNDGCGLASASVRHEYWSAEIRIWNIDNDNDCVHVLSCDHQVITNIVYSPDDRFMLCTGLPVASSVSVILLWSCIQYELLTVINVNSIINQVIWDPMTAYEFVTVGVAGIEFWMLEKRNNMAELKVYQPTDHDLQLPVYAVCYNGSNAYYVGSEGGVVSMWSSTSNKCITRWTTGVNGIRSLCGNSDRVVVGGAEVVQLWEKNDNNVHVMNTSVDIPAGVTGMVFDTELNIGILGTVQHTLLTIDWNEANPIDMIHGHHGNITSLDVSGDNIVTCDSKGRVKVWVMGSDDIKCVLESDDRKGCICSLITNTSSFSLLCGYSNGAVIMNDKTLLHQQSDNTLTMIQMTDSILISSHADGCVLLSDRSNGSCNATITEHKGSTITDLFVHTEPISLPGVAIHSFMILIISSNDGRVSIWKLDHVPVMIDWISFPGPKMEHNVPTLAHYMYPDTVVYTGQETDYKIHFYSLSQKKIVKEHVLQHPVASMCLSHDSQLIAFGSFNQILTIMDSDEGFFQEYDMQSHVITNIRFNNDYLLTTCSHNLYVWRVCGY